MIVLVSEVWLFGALSACLAGVVTGFTGAGAGAGLAGAWAGLAGACAGLAGAGAGLAVVAAGFTGAAAGFAGAADGLAGAATGLDGAGVAACFLIGEVTAFETTADFLAYGLASYLVCAYALTLAIYWSTSSAFLYYLCVNYPTAFINFCSA